MPTPEEDAVLAAYNVTLSAVTLGLGCCFVSMAQKAFAASRSVRKVSGLGGEERVLAVLALGYPKALRRRPVIRTAVPSLISEGTK
jgi:nitroreductase